MSKSDWENANNSILDNENLSKIILDKISILDVLDKFKIEYQIVGTKDFTHKIKCPFPKHANGNERTASLFISENTNSFYCFGCNCSGNLINFIMLYYGKPFHEAVKWLVDFGNVENGSDIVRVKNKKRELDEQVITHVYNAGIIIRDYLSKIDDEDILQWWYRWADKRFIVLDNFLDSLADDDWKVAKEYCDKIKNYLGKNL